VMRANKMKFATGMNVTYLLFLAVVFGLGYINWKRDELFTKKSSTTSTSIPMQTYKGLNLVEVFTHVQRELRNNGKKQCANVKGIIKVPAVKKGMNNQRMRIVQDIMTARLLGAAIELPEYLNTRLNCHNMHACYKNYQPGVKLWDVFDREKTERDLESAGVCIFNPQNYPIASGMEPMPLKVPSPYTNEKLHKYIKDSNAQLSDGYWSLGNDQDCCSKYIPNDKKSVNLLRNINGAFHGVSSITSIAKSVISTLQQQNKNLAIALHWRQDEDFVKTAHALNADKYFNAVIKILIKILKQSASSNPKRILNVILLGDLNVTQSLNIQNQLNQHERLNVIVHTKNTLLPHVNFDTMFHGADDVKGQVDFEIGVHADYFIGSPFSSMSVLIAFHRDRLIVSGEQEKLKASKSSVKTPSSSSSTSSKSKSSSTTTVTTAAPVTTAPVTTAAAAATAAPLPISSSSSRRSNPFDFWSAPDPMKLCLSTSNKYSSETKSMMLKVDVKDNLARIFGIQFPYFEVKPYFTRTVDPCKDIIKAHANFGKNVPESCEVTKKVSSKKAPSTTPKK
jgi:hypothetical protein